MQFHRGLCTAIKAFIILNNAAQLLTAARDAKAVAQGVVQGIKQQRTININRASAADLKSLPGIDDDAAGRIIDHRPYSDSEDLVKRHVISRAEYNRIAGKIEAR